VPEFIDPVFTKTSPKRSFSVIENENERFGLVFAKTWSINSGTGFKRQIYKTSGLQNVRFQNVWFTKLQVYKTSGFKTSGFQTSIEIKASKCPVFK